MQERFSEAVINMDDRAREIQRRYLKREPMHQVARDLGISRARAYQLLEQARKESHAHIQVTGISDHIDRDDLAAYLRQALAHAGITPQKPS